MPAEWNARGKVISRTVAAIDVKQVEHGMKVVERVLKNGFVE